MRHTLVAFGETRSVRILHGVLNNLPQRRADVSDGTIFIVNEHRQGTWIPNRQNTASPDLIEHNEITLRTPS